MHVSCMAAVIMEEFLVASIPSGISCTGSEASLASCTTTSVEGSCAHWQDAGVICQGN